MDCKIWYGCISNMTAAAELTGYKYFLWNGRVYRTSDGYPTAWLDRDRDGVLVEDIPGFRRWLGMSYDRVQVDEFVSRACAA